MGRGQGETRLFPHLPYRFFVVEDTILHTTQGLVPHKGEEEGLVTRGIVNEFWQMALSEVLAVLRNNCVREGGKGREKYLDRWQWWHSIHPFSFSHCSQNSCRNYHLLLKVKQLVVWFCHALKGYGFHADKLYEVLLEIR